MAKYSPKTMKMVDDHVYWMSDEEVRSSFPQTVSIYYGSTTYRDDLEHIEALKEAVWKDYKDMHISDMHVRQLSQKDSDRHAMMIVVQIAIPVEDYLVFCHQHEIGIL